MIGQLYKSQIDEVLYSQLIGRIGCYADKRIYVVPVMFAYDGKYIYAHSKNGMKIKMMRKNPDVCFEVDGMDSMANWRSVIVWGTFEEMKDTASQTNGMKILMDKLQSLKAGETVKPTVHSMRPEMLEKEIKAIVYRIKIVESTGRFEKTM